MYVTYSRLACIDLPLLNSKLVFQVLQMKMLIPEK